MNKTTRAALMAALLLAAPAASPFAFAADAPVPANLQEALRQEERARQATQTTNTQTTQTQLSTATRNVESLRTSMLAREANVTEAQISAMRASGTGWGEIAHSLGVHPGNLGLGHKDGFGKKSSTDDATTESKRSKGSDDAPGKSADDSSRGKSADAPGKSGSNSGAGKSGNSGGGSSGGGGNSGGGGKGGGKK